MFEDNSKIIAVLEKSRTEYQIKADALEAEYNLTRDENVFSEFELCYENIYEICDQIRYYSKKRVGMLTRIKRAIVFHNAK